MIFNLVEAEKGRQAQHKGTKCWHLRASSADIFLISCLCVAAVLAALCCGPLRTPNGVFSCMHPRQCGRLTHWQSSWV